MITRGFILFFNDGDEPETRDDVEAIADILHENQVGHIESVGYKYLAEVFHGDNYVRRFHVSLCYGTDSQEHGVNVERDLTEDEVDAINESLVRLRAES